MTHNRKPHPLIIIHGHRDSHSYTTVDQATAERPEPYDTTLIRPADRPFNDAYRYFTQHVHETKAKVLIEVHPGSSQVQVTCPFRWYLLNYQLCHDAGLELFHTINNIGPAGSIGGVNVPIPRGK